MATTRSPLGPRKLRTLPLLALLLACGGESPGGPVVGADVSETPCGVLGPLGLPSAGAAPRFLNGWRPRRSAGPGVWSSAPGASLEVWTPAAPVEILLRLAEPPAGGPDSQITRVAADGREIAGEKVGNVLRITLDPGTVARRRLVTLEHSGDLHVVGGRTRIAAASGPAASPPDCAGGSPLPPDRSPERRGAADEDPGPPPQPPRLVVLYVMDALRADTVAAALEPTWTGAAEDVAVLRRLASEGHLFLEHRAVAPNTLPSTKALLTGSVWAQRGGWALPAGATSLAERFRAAGYRTALFSNNPYVSAEYGIDQGFDHVAPQDELDAGAAGYHDDAEVLHRGALSWLDELGLAEGSAPAFVYLHVLHPHNPYAPPAEVAEPFLQDIGSTIGGDTGTLLAVARGRLDTTEADRLRLRRLYQASFAYAARELGSFLSALEARRSPGDTLLVLTSDHGEELFEHRGALHGYTLYEEMIRIPLLLWAPGRLPAGATATPSSTVDLHHSLCELSTGSADCGSGRSLWQLALSSSSDGPGDESLRTQRGSPHFAAAASVRGGIFSAQQDRWKLISAPQRGDLWGQGTGPGRSRDVLYLFDLERDPDERRNLVASREPEHHEALWRLRSALERWLAERLAAPLDDASGAEPEVDPEARRRLEALGYVGG